MAKPKPSPKPEQVLNPGNLPPTLEGLSKRLLDSVRQGKIDAMMIIARPTGRETLEGIFGQLNAAPPADLQAFAEKSVMTLSWTRHLRDGEHSPGPKDVVH